MRGSAVAGHLFSRLSALRRAAEPVRRHLIERLEPRRLLAEPQISEFLASNANGIEDGDGDRPDWVEIYNPNASPLNLQDYYLTDDATNLTRWRLPSVTIAPNDYLVVFASGKNRLNPAELHTNFSLDVGGEYLALVAPNGTGVVSNFGTEYPKQQTDVSYGPDASSAGSPPRYYAMPTPGEANARSEVVINEIHYDPDVKTELVEFVELYNPSPVAIDLSGAFFSSGIEYEFPEGTVLPPGQYLVVALNAQHFAMKFGFAPSGQFSGRLSNEGETLTLRNRGGGDLDVVDYQLGFPWPTVGDSPGYSIELINADFDNSLGGNWRSFRSNPVSETTLVSSGSVWHYRKGTTEVSSPITAWRQPGFTEDGTWFTNGTAPLGYGENFIATDLSDMNQATRPPGYSVFYLRKTFSVSDLSGIGSLRMEARFDDGFNVWINGKFAAGSNVGGSELTYQAVASSALENLNFVNFNIPGSAASFLNAGDNVIAVQVLNSSLSGSTDAFFDMRLFGVPPAVQSSPTPGGQNSIHAINGAPQMRQVNHSPQQPVSNQPVTITAKVTDPQGVAAVSLKYQIVEPGQYIELSDAAYQTNWATLSMRDDGTLGDAVAGDGVYSVLVPGSVQQHRRLVRYRITAMDGLGESITAPYADDPQPNFAYFVYDGIPNYQAAVQPGSSDPTKAQVRTFGPEVMNSIATYHLITKRESHVESQHIPFATTPGYTGDNYLWNGALVYNGVVYDHIRYRARGGVWRYAMGKNMWKIDLNRGHDFQALDAYGNPYPVKWTKINLGANIQQGNFSQRGEQGLFEHVGFKLFNLADVPSSNTLPVQFRIIETSSELGDPGNQYDDDFQGLYLAVEQDDGRFLDSHDLPDGNLYRIENGTGPGNGSLNNQGPTQPTDHSDLISFRNSLSQANEQWLRDNIELERYYSYRSMVEAIHHWDIGFGKNFYWYHNPETNKWEQVPWDLDLTWTTTYEPINGDNEPFKSPVLSKPSLLLEYRNRLREIRDLLFNLEQVGLMLDEYAALVDPAGAGVSMVDADRAMWDYNPILANGGYVNLGKAGQGKFYEAAVGGRTFEGMVQKLKNYVLTRSAYIDNSILTADEEENVPGKPVVSYTGSTGFPVDDLRFATTGFVPGTGKGGTFAAMQWRIADVTPVAPGMPPNYEIDAVWESGELTSFNPNVTIPASVVIDGRRYRVRARFLDSNGRWSHWSNASEFTSGALPTDAVDALRITELNYHPGAPGIGSEHDRNDFEFVELKNISSHSINLEGVRFTGTLEFTFGDMVLAPGAHVLVVRDFEAFEDRYGDHGFLIAGEFENGSALSDGGEQLLLVDSTGATIHDFVYDDAWHPTTDGGEFTLVVTNENAPVGNWSSPAQWRPSVYRHGTPGADESLLAAGSIVINEALTHTDAVTGDWIELYNTTGSAIDISHWWLSDSDENRQKFQIPANTVIPAGGYVVFTQFGHFDVLNGPGVRTAFGLAEAGERVVLSGANRSGALNGYSQEHEFGAAEKEVTFGRVVTSTGSDFVAVAGPTFGGANAPAKIGPVVMTEILYNPVAGGDEFVELRNVSGAIVNLSTAGGSAWRFTDGITFSFSGNVTLSPGEMALVVGIDPAAFRSKYGLSPALKIFGPYTGALDNGGERLTLSRPGALEPSGFVPYIAVDSIRYDDAAPWPASADGGGASLGRVNAHGFTNDAANWVALGAGGTPGAFPGADSTPPTLDIVDVVPDPRDGSVDAIMLSFSEPIVGLSLSDLVLARSGSGNLLDGTQTLTSSDGIHWKLGNVGKATFAGGIYTVSLDAGAAGITDFFSNPLSGSAADSFRVNATVVEGTSGNDTLTLRRFGNNLEILRGGVLESTAPITPESANVVVNTFGGNGDVITIDFSGGNPFEGGMLRLNVAGSRFHVLDRVSITGTAGNDTITLDSQGVLFNGTRIVPGRVGTLDLNAGDGNDTFTVSAATNLSLGFVGGAGSNVMLVQTGKHIISANAGVGTAVIVSGNSRVDFAVSQDLASLTLNGTSRANFLATQTIGTLTLNNSARADLAAGSNRALRLNNLVMSGSALLELNDNDLLLRPASAAERDALFANVRQWIINGRNNGLWNGSSGIVSTAARNNVARTTGLVVIKNTDNGVNIIRSDFGGIGGLNALAILVKYSWNGDSDAGGRINPDDYFRIDRGFLKDGMDYRNGDLNFDGIVNIADYLLIDQAFLGQTGIL